MAGALLAVDFRLKFCVLANGAFRGAWNPEHQNGKAGGGGACHSVILSFCHVFKK